MSLQSITLKYVFKRLANTSLLNTLKGDAILKNAIIRAAQEIYNDWDQNEDGIDEVSGGGGICDEISQAITTQVLQKYPELDCIDGGQDGDDHSFPVFYNDLEAVIIDIPYNVYETGGGYSWKKKPNIVFTPEHIFFESTPRGDI